MNDRHTADTITDDALDALYEQLDAAEESEAQQQLATAREAFAAATTRAARAEAALNRVRALHQPQHDGSGFPDSQQCSTCSQDGGDGYQYLVPWPCPTIRALDGEQPAPAPAATEATTGHVYLSTGCLHGHHDYCQNHTGHSGTKTPAQCKFCAAPCTCGCHQHHMTRPADQPKEQRERPTHPDGTPFRYHEINAEGWEHCDGCGLWGQWTVANPHECANDRVQPAEQPKEQ